MMKGLPIKQNLSTSFVDLSLLVRYLRDRQFTGSVRLEWEKYEAEIFFTRSKRIHAREYDKSIGRIAQGQTAFCRILQRSRKPSGRIRIVRNDAEKTAAILRRPFVDSRISAEARLTAYGKSDQVVSLSELILRPQRRPADTQAALLATDLLLTFKEAFARTGISFDQAFNMACEVKSAKHGFLEPERNEFSFYRDEIFIGPGIDTIALFEGIVAALRHMLNRIRDDKRCITAVVYLRHSLQRHLSNRHNDYRSFGLLPTVDRLIG
jgi:hypothetical protein